MSFAHDLYVDLDIHEDAQIEQIVAAISPVVEFLQYPESAIAGFVVEEVPVPATNSLGDDEDQIYIVVDPKGTNPKLYIKTAGEVHSTFYDAVEKMIENLSPLCFPGVIELHNHTTGDLSSSITEYWVGAGEELIQAKRRDAFAGFKHVLEETGVPKEYIESLKEMVLNLPIESTEKPLIRPKG